MILELIAFALRLANPDLATTVSSLGPGSDYRSVEHIAQFGCAAVPYLVEQLEETRPVAVAFRDSNAHQAEMRLLWSIATLRYITNVDFYSHQIVREDRSSARQQMLTSGAPPGKTKIFGVWMSRGMAYFAAREEQRDIIRQWREYNVAGHCQNGRQNRNLDFWLYGGSD